jgi:polysaccharide export outer membrane protein
MNGLTMTGELGRGLKRLPEGANMIARTLLFVALGVPGCLPASQGADVPTTRPEAAAPASKPEASGPQFQTRNPRYQVRPGDVLDLLFSPTAEFNQSIAVQPDGFVTLREAGDFYIQGKTIPEVKEAITTIYGKILHDPVVTVVLKDFEKPHFTVGGEVGKPGKYDLRADTTVSEAVAIAGSINEKAKHSQILLFRRVSDDWVEVKNIDLRAIYKGKIAEDIHLRPGDMLFVPQNRISKIKPYLPVWGISSYMSPTKF